MIWIILAIYILSSSLGMILIKLGGQRSHFSIQEQGLNSYISFSFLFGIFLFVLSFVLWIFILQRFKLTFISPVAYGLTFVVLSFFSYILLQEKLTIYNLAGASLIIIGVVVSYMGSNNITS